MMIGCIVQGRIQQVIFAKAGKFVGSNQSLSIFASVSECVSSMACVLRKYKRKVSLFQRRQI